MNGLSAGLGAGGLGALVRWQHCTLFPPGHRLAFQLPPSQETRDLSRHWPELSLQDAWMQHFTPTGSLGQASMTVKPCVLNLLA